MIWKMITSTREHFFKKRFSKLDFLKTALVTITANSEKRKWKNHNSFWPLHSSTFPLFLIGFLYPFFENFISLFKNRGGTGRPLRTMYIHLKIYKIIFDYFCGFSLKHWMIFFEWFYCCLPCLISFLTKTRE